MFTRKGGKDNLLDQKKVAAERADEGELGRMHLRFICEVKLNFVKFAHLLLYNHQL